MQERKIIFWLLLIFASLYILGNIGTGSLTTWDEALYANISKNMISTGNWLIMHDRPDKPWFDKPPLYMWCTAIFYKTFGINEFSTRLTSSLFGIATVMLVYVFAKKISDKNTALLSSLLLLAAPHFIHYSKIGMMDVTLAFFITLMIFFFWEGQERPSYLFWSGIVLILAYLAKGMAAISGPAIIFTYCLCSGNLKSLVKREFVLGISISLVLIIMWHILQYVYGGPESIGSYFGFHLFKRATQSLEGHTGGMNFYQSAIFNKNRPWGVIYYPSFVYAAWISFKDKDKKAILFTAWAASVLVICTIVKTKLHWYIMPIYPALAIMSSLFMERLFRGKAFYVAVAVILAGMIIQVPVSYAFKLDFNQKAKNAAMNSIKLPYEDNGTIFYENMTKLRKGHST